MTSKRFFTVLLCSLFTVTLVSADEGMWLPDLIDRQVKAMQAKGLKISADDIYSTDKPSLKDAIVLFGRGCTGELVSPEGLLLTNHHCGLSQIQSHSGIGHDYLTNGFWAMKRSEELPNPGLSVTLLVRMEDVTGRVLAGVGDGMPEDERGRMIEKNCRTVIEEATLGTHYTADIRPLYYGNVYYLYVNEVFTDVRLVAAPPSSIGSFGGDTDNWMWPRHSGDFALFRIYAGPDNKPAGYSPDNVPYKPRKHFTISTHGVDEGGFTFVYGYPARTTEYVVSDMVDYTLNYANPEKIRLRTMRLDIIKAAQDADPAVRIQYASKAARIANAWKKWQGESLGLERLGTVGKKQEYESRFREWAKDKPAYRDVLPRLHKAYEELRPYALARDYYNETIGAIELLTPAASASWATKEFANFESFYKDYVPDIDRRISKILVSEYFSNVPEPFRPAAVLAGIDSLGGTDNYVDHLFDNSVFTTAERYRAVEKLDSAGYVAVVGSDPVTMFRTELRRIYIREITPEYVRLTNEIDELYHTYMRGQMEFEPHRNFYPDANQTLRIAYGSIGGYHAADAVWHKHYTTIDGIIEKDDPDIYDYNVPQRLRQVYDDKDYGRWAVNAGTGKEPRYTVPVNFIASNHTTGGNSGSPLLNGRGELVGLNFDRTWLSTMSDLEFDPEICRNISVDIRYVLFVIDKIGGAGYLFEEMTLK